jgi:hypothetical protein
MDTITVSLPSNLSGTLLDVYALEYSGVGALDAVTGQNGTTSDMHSGFVTTTAPGDLIFGFAVVVPMGSAAAGTGFLARETQHEHPTEDEIFTGPGRVEATVIMTGGNAWTMMVLRSSTLRPRPDSDMLARLRGRHDMALRQKTSGSGTHRRKVPGRARSGRAGR